MDIYLDSKMRKDELSLRLIQMAEHDLSAREKLQSENRLWKGYEPEREAVHRENADGLRQIIAEIGWPTRPKVGAEGSEAAWLIVQHAIGEASFMRECYELIRHVAADIDPQHLAYLHDRICYFSGKPQRYGTQYEGDHLFPVEDAGALNSLRADVQLPPIPAEKVIVSQHLAEPGTRQDLHTDPTFNQWRKKAGWI